MGNRDKRASNTLSSRGKLSKPTVYSKKQNLLMQKDMLPENGTVAEALIPQHQRSFYSTTREKVR